jgi:anaerobic magnesium-protoporphyrin IX monomethyl ester cyclase
MSGNGSVDLVLVNPSSRKKVYQSLGKELSAIEPPVWAGLMATFVRNHGHRVAIIDAEAEELTAPQTVDRILALKPRLTAVVV